MRTRTISTSTAALRVAQRTEAGLRRAAEYFKQAVARAPRYARAYVGLGDAYAVLGFYDYLAPRESFPQAEAAALGRWRSTRRSPHRMRR